MKRTKYSFFPKYFKRFNDTDGAIRDDKMKLKWIKSHYNAGCKCNSSPSDWAKLSPKPPSPQIPTPPSIFILEKLNLHASRGRQRVPKTNYSWVLLCLHCNVEQPQVFLYKIRYITRLFFMGHKISIIMSQGDLNSTLQHWLHLTWSSCSQESF